MRPIVLELDGFASFREAATVDFTDADFFALVGPTGSGKSTVIDAMTFALYGSVPRWGRKGMVSLALAPTVARGTVKLVFEVENQRYVVVRELRRVSTRTGSTVSQRAAAIERITAPGGLARPGEATVPLAKDLTGVTEAVERLLGLSYDDFCQCVVLPQGQFANFLHARAGDRQEILLRLLGAEHYRRMMTQANQRAATAAERAGVIEETVRGFADATEEAEAAARAAERDLAGLSERVTALQPRILAAEADLAGAIADRDRLATERAALAAVTVPGGVAGLDADLSAARLAVAEVRGAEKEAEDADGAARAALAAGPARAPLEQARDRRRDLAGLTARRPGLDEEAGRLGGQADRARARVTEAAAALEDLRARRDEAGQAAEAAAQRVATLDAEHAALAAVAVPAGTGQLDERRQAAIAAAESAATALDEAEEADRAARTALAAAPGESALEQARRDLHDLRDRLAETTQARARLRDAQAGRTAAGQELAAAEATLEQAQQQVEAARRAHAAAGLRLHLVAGQPCPVCEQPVRTLPAAQPAPAAEAAQTRLTGASRAVTTAREQVQTAASVQDRAAAALDAAAAQRDRRVASLATLLTGPLAGAGLPETARLLAFFPATGPAGPAAAADGDPGHADEPERATDQQVATAAGEVEAALGARRALDEAAAAADRAAGRARAVDRAARQDRDRAEADTTAARAALREARDPLVALGAPPVDEASLAGTWQRLAVWATEQAGARAAGLSEARDAARVASGQHERARAGFGEAERELAARRAAAEHAAEAGQRARAQLDGLTERIAELGRLLDGSPGEDEITAQLAVRDQLEAAAAAAGDALLAARAARIAAEDGLGRLEQTEATARAGLAAARDRVVGLGAPALDGTGLLAGWTTLADWAAAAATERERAAADTGRRVSAARDTARELTGQLAADLDRHEVNRPTETAAVPDRAGGTASAGWAAYAATVPPGAFAASAGRAVDRALGLAQAATVRVAERRAEVAGHTARLEAARDEQQVARMLADLLRSDRFPRWLVAEAVDVLAAEASANLAGLSNGQFDLAWDEGEFYVIDHADADARRSVRTLSGGETFQASLALALALSSQMSGLATAGAARLDSIFLDEGFGTLDPETLEVVASTLETLATGRRMVGVITHVAALAERVPVRFLVSRDARTSRVVRESAALADEGAA